MIYFQRRTAVAGNHVKRLHRVLVEIRGLCEAFGTGKGKREWGCVVRSELQNRIEELKRTDPLCRANQRQRETQLAWPNLDPSFQSP